MALVLGPVCRQQLDKLGRLGESLKGPRESVERLKDMRGAVDKVLE